MGGIIFNIILLIVFSTFLWISFGIEDLREVDPLGASGFPKFVLILIVLLLLVSLASEIKKHMKDKYDESNSNISKHTFIRIGTITILLALFILLLDYLGFLLSSLLLTPALLLILGEKKKLRLTFITFFIPIIFTVLFGDLLSIPLPRGVGIFLNISRLIY